MQLPVDPGRLVQGLTAQALSSARPQHQQASIRISRFSATGIGHDKSLMYQLLEAVCRSSTIWLTQTRSLCKNAIKSIEGHLLAALA